MFPMVSCKISFKKGNLRALQSRELSTRGGSSWPERSSWPCEAQLCAAQRRVAWADPIGVARGVSLIPGRYTQ